MSGPKIDLHGTSQFISPVSEKKSFSATEILEIQLKALHDLFLKTNTFQFL